jgi:hypothetical protein
VVCDNGLSSKSEILAFFEFAGLLFSQHFFFFSASGQNFCFFSLYRVEYFGGFRIANDLFATIGG